MSPAAIAAARRVPRVVVRSEERRLAPGLAAALREYHWRRSFIRSECLLRDTDHGPKGEDPPILPDLPSARSQVYLGGLGRGSYNHHVQIARHKGRFYVAWSNGVRNEEDAGQRVLIADSADARSWSPARVVLDVPAGEPYARNCVAMRSDGERLHVAVMTEETIHDATATGMRRIDNQTSIVEIRSSADGFGWERTFSFGNRVRWIFEAPRPTREGRLLCLCNTTREGPAALLWPGLDLGAEPAFIPIPEPEDASFPYGEATWYQDDEGLITVFWRDEGASCRMYANESRDGGRTFSVPVLTDIPDSMSRIYAGRLGDGRFYLVNNAVGTLLDRSALLLLLSRDGAVFDDAWIVNDDATAMRRKGLLKTNGLQYPCCLAHEGRLYVAYDANKEDILCDSVAEADLVGRPAGEA